MRNIFTFWPVGQGLFYTGIIDDFTMVYDVGTANNQEFLDKQIEVFGSKLEHCHGNKVIDVLFLSHYDKDHISGLAKLDKEKFQIKKIIAPFITPVVKLFYLLELLQDDIDNVTEFDLEKVLTTYSDNNILFVHPINGDIDTNDTISEIDISSLGINNNVSNNELTGIVNAKYKDIWRFKFIAQTYQTPGNLDWIKKVTSHAEKIFNVKIIQNTDDNINQIANELFKSITKLLNKGDMAKVIQLITKINSINKELIKQGKLLIEQGKKEKLVKDQKELIRKGNILIQEGESMDIRANVISLVLYHEPIPKDCTLYLMNQPRINRRTYLFPHWTTRCIKTIENKSGQLLTGDSVFAVKHQKNKKDFYIPIKETWNPFKRIFLNSNNIGVSLLPHHGSKFGWVDDFLNHTNTFIVSYGLGNTHNHPHSVVTDSILMSQNYDTQLIEINQNENSILNIFVDSI